LFASKFSYILELSLPASQTPTLGADKSQPLLPCQSAMAVPVDPELRKTWKRVLYEKQGYPDDHVDDTFLESLVTNGKTFLGAAKSMSSPLCRSQRNAQWILDSCETHVFDG